MFVVSRRSTDVGLVLPPALPARHIRVRPVVPDQVPPGLGDVHDHAGQKLRRVEVLGHIAKLPREAVVTPLRPVEHLTIPTPLHPLEAIGARSGCLGPSLADQHGD